MKRVVFIDRDGTIIREPRDNRIDSLEKLELIPGIIGGLKLLVDAGFALVMVTNQDDLGSNEFPWPRFELPQKKLLTLLKGEGITFEKVFICPHNASDGCTCRKPKTGLVERYLAQNKIDLAHSFMLGDRVTDVEFGMNIGVNPVRLSKQKATRGEYSTPSALEACKYIVQHA